MDQGPLVSEQMAAGAKLVEGFAKWAPLSAAFWLKTAENPEWYLCLVTERVNNARVGPAYDEVNRLLGPRPHLWLEGEQVKVVGTDNRIAQDIIAIQQKDPEGLYPRVRTQLLGGVYVLEAFLYKVPLPATN